MCDDRCRGMRAVVIRGENEARVGAKVKKGAVVH